jgi:hypothetical protein
MACRSLARRLDLAELIGHLLEAVPCVLDRGRSAGAPSNADDEGDERRPRLRNPTSLPYWTKDNQIPIAVET